MSTELHQQRGEELDPNRAFSRVGLLVFVAVVLVGIAAILYFHAGSGTPTATTTTTAPAEVSLAPVYALSSTSTFSTVGHVESVSSANLKVQAAGPVTTVKVQVGDTVRAGSVIATIDNAAQYAALLQAKGAYTAAKANAAVSGVSIAQADDGINAAYVTIESANRSAYNAVNNVVLNSLDQFYSNPISGIIGFRVASTNQSGSFNNERVAYRAILSDWQTRTGAVSSSTAESTLDYATEMTNRTLDLVNRFISLTTNDNGADTVNGKALGSYNSEMLADQATLNGILTALSGARSAYNAALSAKQKAELGAGAAPDSATTAQIDVAYGALQAAQVAYDKTIITSPISGVVNALYLKAGDYATPGEAAAVVANNGGLEVKTFVSQSDSLDLAVGDAVELEGGAKGVVAAKASALDPMTGKVPVVIAVTDTTGLVNGATVTVTFMKHQHVTTTDLTIPLTALKLTASGPFVFEVTSTSSLHALPVVIGELAGENVTITSGLTASDTIVTDARGLKDGQSVTVVK